MLYDIFAYFVRSFRVRLSFVDAGLLSLPGRLLTPTPIIPIMTSKARSLASYLQGEGLVARPIVWPTVPKGMDRVRICLHAKNTREEIDRLIGTMASWAARDMSIDLALNEAKL